MFHLLLAVLFVIVMMSHLLLAILYVIVTMSYLLLAISFVIITMSQLLLAILFVIITIKFVYYNDNTENNCFFAIRATVVDRCRVVTKTESGKLWVWTASQLTTRVAWALQPRSPHTSVGSKIWWTATPNMYPSTNVQAIPCHEFLWTS